jgi:thiol-disulfide isomerase/thioredoxin
MFTSAIVAAVVGDGLTATLKPVAPGKETGNLRWSPKGAAVEMKSVDGALVGQFELGPKGSKPVLVRLDRVDGSKWVNRFSVDLNRDGVWQDGEIYSCEPSERNGNWWSSFTTGDVMIPTKGGAMRGYPISFWYVEDPTKPDAPKTLRWSRRGWHEGTVEIDGKSAFVLITEMNMDGVFDQRDAWFLARDRKDLLAAMSRGMEDHAWLDGKAYRLTKIDPDGGSVTFEGFDPGMTEAEEATKRDTLLDDKNAKRAEKPVPFGNDFEAAVAMARSKESRMLIDFEATWCGPCHTMDELVYTSADVVSAASGIVCVKVDGDIRKDLVEKYSVGAYPTMILMGADGKEVRRAVGYRSVKEMVEFLGK